MAKLTARFDIQDNISKKLRAIRGEIDSLERARNNVNKPMLMRVKDQATGVLKRLHMFVLKDIAKTHMLIVQLKDQAMKPLNALSNFMRRKMPKTHGMLVTANDKATSVMKKIGHYAKSNIIGIRMMQIRATDRAMPVIRRVGSLARSTLFRGFSFTVRAVDAASRVVRRVASFTATSIPRVRDFTIRAINGAANVIGSIKRAIFSIPTLITVTLAAVGINSLGKSTVGAAMTFEGYGVAMDHWLDGNKEKAKELMTWMGQFADKTPFTSADLFPALTTGIAISETIPEAQKLLRVATDMAALTPGKTVEDAMDALASAQMGSFMALRGFQMKVTKKSYDKMGGFSALVASAEKTFSGGAMALSATASGMLSTIKGYMGGFFRSMGVGVLDNMKPRLKSIIKFLDENQEGWQKWKQAATDAASQVSGVLIDKISGAFALIKNDYLDNPEFMNADWKGKISFIMDDIGAWWTSKGKPALDGWWQSTGKPWAATIGLTIGEAIFSGVVLGIQKGLGTIGEMWKDVGVNVKENGINKETATSAAGAGAATLGIGAIALAAASFVLTPIIKGIQVIGKVGGWAAGKIKGNSSPGTRAEKPPKAAKVARASRPPHYTMPWTNRGERPTLNVPNARDKGFKLPKGLSSIGNFAKRIPILGTALGALTIATSSKKDMAGNVGAVGGGLGGAALGAAVGSVVPGLGTAIGGIIGGVVGSMSGGSAGDWLSDNWDAIKEGAASTVDWMGEAWNSTADWFSNYVWTPMSDGASNAVGWISDKWSALSGWFMGSVWNPIANGFDKSISFIVGLYDIAEQVITTVWSALTGWFTDKVWNPLKTVASTTWDWVTNKFTGAWTAIQVVWSAVSDWFMESVWNPLTTAAEFVMSWVGEKFDAAWTIVKTVWGVAWSWFQETIWTPLMTAVEVVGTWIGEKFSEGWNAVTAIWAIATSWFEETVWSPVSTAVGLLGTWIGEKFSEGWTVVSEIWGIAAGYFEENIWTPIKTGAAAVKDAIITPFAEAWEFVSGIFSKLGDTWDSIKSWGSGAVDYVVSRGEERRGITPEKNATGGHITRPTLSWVGEAGNEYVIPTQNNLGRGRMLLSQAANDLGMSVYDNGSSTVSQDQLAAISSSGGSGKQSVGSKVRDIVVQITGENHYSDDMDAERVGRVAFEYVKRQLEHELFTGGEEVYDV